MSTYLSGSWKYHIQRDPTKLLNAIVFEFLSNVFSQFISLIKYSLLTYWEDCWKCHCSRSCRPCYIVGMGLSCKHTLILVPLSHCWLKVEKSFCKISFITFVCFLRKNYSWKLQQEKSPPPLNSLSHLYSSAVQIQCFLIRCSLLACCVVIKKRRIRGTSALSTRLEDDQGWRIVRSGNKISRYLLVHVTHLLVVHLLLLLKKQQVMMMDRWWGMMWWVRSMIDLIAMQVVDRQSLTLLVIVVAIVIVLHLSQLWFPVVVVAIVVIVRVVLDHHLRRRTRLTVWWNQREHRKLARRVRLILLVLVCEWVVHLIHRQCTVSRCAICNFRRIVWF